MPKALGLSEISDLDLKTTILLMVLLSLTSCTTEPMEEEEFSTVFRDHKKDFELLKTMAIQDMGENRLMLIGDRNTNSPSQEKVTQYRSKLKRVGAKRITVIRESENNIETTFLLFTSGFVFGGCSSSITNIQSGELFRPSWADPYIEINLGENWYGQTKCN